MGSLMKAFGGLLGRKATPDVILPGFLGLTLIDGGESPTVHAVLENGPAGKGGLRAGDKVTKFGGRTVTNTEDVLRFARRVRPGQTVRLTVLRDKETKELKFTMGEGF
jgi:serine protease DegQ